MFGQVLRDARKAAGFTQERLAANAGVDRTHISYLENDKTSPTLEMIFRLSDELGVKPAILVEAADKARHAANE